MTFEKGDRVYLPGDDQYGTIAKVIEKADGLWAEQFYEFNPDDTPDWYVVTMAEHLIAAQTDDAIEPADSDR